MNSHYNDANILNHREHEMPGNTTPRQITEQDIMDSSLQGISVTVAYQDLLLVKAKAELEIAQNHHKKLQDENPYTKNHAIGEDHFHAAPKRFVMEQMPEYAKQGYKILFVEHFLYDEHQADLDAFNQSGLMSRALSEYICKLNDGHMDQVDNNDNGIHNYTGVLNAAQAHGIRVVALDTSLSYSFNSYEKLRALAFSLTAAEIISREAGLSKWVAFMGTRHNHMTHFNDNSFVPGIANLFPNTIAVNVFDRIKNAADTVPLLIAQRNAERKIFEDIIYADIGITVDATIPLNIDLARVQAPKSLEITWSQKIWAERTGKAPLCDLSSNNQSLDQVLAVGVNQVPVAARENCA